MLQSLNRWSVIVKLFLTVLVVLIMSFALISGSESYGGGLKGIVKNSPNALPWLLLLIPVILAWKYEKIAGIVITIIGLIAVYFFNTGPNFFVSTFFATLTIPVCGVALWLLANAKAKLSAT